MKIDIIGSVASGKTTLARRLGKIYQIPHIEKDNVVWERGQTGDRKRSPEERDALFQELLTQNSWIVEGSPRKSLHESAERADWIILLEPPLIVRLKQVLKRWWHQKRGVEEYHGQPTLAYLLQQIHWIFSKRKRHREYSRYSREHTLQ